MMSYKRGVVRAGYGDGSRGDTGGPAFESMLVRDVKYVDFEFIHDPFVNSFVTRPLRQKFTTFIIDRAKSSRSADGMATW